MKKYLAAVALAATLAQPAAAITFPSLTTIYVGAGVSDDGSSSNVGIATSFSCSNVSGATATIRFLVLSSVGAVNSQSTFPIAHGANITVSTHFTTTFAEDGSLATGQVQP